MRTSLTEIAEIDAYVSGQLQAPEKLLFQARLLVNPRLGKEMRYQQMVYKLIRLFARKQLKQELQDVQKALLLNPDKRAFRDELTDIFNKH